MCLYCGLVGTLQIFLLIIAPIHGQYRDGDIRLVGGSYQWEGRVEIYFSGTWGTITDSDWTSDDAQVVCRKLGHFKPGATAHSRAYFGEGSGLIHLIFVKCSGSEYNVTECDTESVGTSSTHSLDVGVKCQPADEAYREGDIRLVGGSYNWEGRVEIYWSGTWGAISDSSWTAADASVVCRQLQHSGNGVEIPCCDIFGEGRGPIHIHIVTCVGSEANITDCNYQNNTVITNHQQDVGVQCQQGNETKEWDIRLVGGKYLWEGRVEIFLHGVWGTFCDDGAYTNDAFVVCRQLGYTIYNANYFCCAWFGQGIGPIHIDDLACSGSEYRISHCRFYSYHNCHHSEDWSVYCNIDGFESGDVRLSSTSYYGQVEVFLSGRWQPVSDSDMSWTQENADVVCRELGYTPNATFFFANDYSGSSDYDQMYNVRCAGTESKLTNCIHSIANLESYTSPWMECTPYNCYDGDVRLVGGETEAEGRVELCNNERWGTVCDNKWTDNHTAVVCRHLGFSDLIGNSAYFTSKRFGMGTGPIFIDYINCTGSEPRLWGKCSHFPHSYGCSHNDDVGVQCAPASCSDSQIRLIEGDTELYGRVEICYDQRWETLNYYQWSYYNARVVCAELGFLRSYINWRSKYGRGGGPIHPNYYQCAGNEGRLSQCVSYNETGSRTHYDDVGIYCRPAACADGELRLSEGETEWEGRVEVCLGQRWGIVGNDGWTEVNSHVICNALGYDFTVFSDKLVNQTIPQALSKPVYLHNIVCSRRDLTLLECSFTKYAGNINDFQDVIINCQEPTCSDGDLKLVGGASETEGRLEVCFNRRWGTIDGDGWTHSDTQVACKQLGHSTSDLSYKKIQRTRSSSSSSSSQSLPVHMTLVGCYSTNERLTDCSYHEFSSSSSIATSMDVSISCGSDSDSDDDSDGSAAVDSAGMSDELNSVSVASLSVAVICASVVIILVAILIIVYMLKQKKKKYTIRNEPATQQMQDTDTGYRYHTAHFDELEGESVDKEKMDDVSMDSYEEVVVNAPVIPAKPKPKALPKKPNVNTLDSTRYVRSSDQKDVRKPATMPQMRPQIHGRVQQKLQVRPESPEVIYEVPD